jgi:putative ABC transport system permease protein
MTRPRLTPARLHLGDVVRVGWAGLHSRPMRALLSALGIAIGIAAMIAVVGISASSRAGLDRMLSSLGTNLLTVEPGRTILGQDAKLPLESVAMIDRIGPVLGTAAVGKVSSAKVYRNDRIAKARSSGIDTLAASTDLKELVGATLDSGIWLNDATARFPAVVLGSATAERLGVGSADPGVQVSVGGVWFTVIGVLDPVPLAPELDSAALVGWSAAQSHLGFDGHPTTVYARTDEAQVEVVRAVLASTANPKAPDEVMVSRPSDLLAARQATDRTFRGLLLGLGGVALLVGGIGVANTMVISVLERRAEIGLRRSLGATKGQIRTQFLTESLLLSAMGGIGGVLIGIVVTGVYASTQSWPTVVPPLVMLGGVGATVLIGGLAGLYPAVRASRLTPTAALAAA